MRITSVGTVVLGAGMRNRVLVKITADGHASPPAGPGPSNAVDERAAARHPAGPEPQLASRLPDASVADR